MTDNQKVWLYRALHSILLAAVLIMQYTIMKDMFSTRTAETVEAQNVAQVN